MEICPPPCPQLNSHRPITLVKKAICVDHGGNCNCCCCCASKKKLFKYVQPEVPKSFAPIRTYWKSGSPMERYTTYERSYWRQDPTSSRVKPFKHQVSLTVGDGPITDDTTHRLSYLGNWCLRQSEPHMVPCDKQWLGRGPMENATTNRCDYTWKLLPRRMPLKNRENLCFPNANLSSDTTYKLSYYGSGCTIPVSSFKPIRKYMKGNVPFEECTTYKLSYWPNEVQTKPPKKKVKYYPPLTALDGCTTYGLSYWPSRQPRRKPILTKNTENILNAGCCSDENTTYNLSYFGCGGARRMPIRPSPSTKLSTCPLSHDTIHRMSYLGNWCVTPEVPVIPCPTSWSGRGPIQDLTTQKESFIWKSSAPGLPILPRNNLRPSDQPLEGCTTQRLSYFPNDLKDLTKNKSFKPIRVYKPFDIPAENETTMRLSYQPVETPIPTNHSPKQIYKKPLTPSNDNTTYHLSYLPPGKVEELDCVPQCRS
ncbi:protein FAM154A-like [Fopius arisanus]|uniref:Protein FAM154A-like n=1 Tax=Fopius arisanus TaxID=64838 RepID=A0A9R1T0A5_9HYME|nr:PREDICTED: protein FAM154A-like [Fopius arisanus]